MADKPILFSGPMIRALLDGRKTQTRRIVKLADNLFDKAFTGELVNYYGDHRLGMAFEDTTMVQPIPYAIGDQLWVREAWARVPIAGAPETIDNPVWIPREGCPLDYGGPWKPGIHMFRADSRLTLTVTDVRVHRLQEISEEDAKAEGATHWWRGLPEGERNPKFTSVGMFRDLWDSLNATRGFGWDANPWVAAYSFNVHRCNIDQMGDEA